MRSLLLFLTGAVFVLGFTAFFLVSSLLGYAADPEAVVESAHEAGLRESAVLVVTQIVLRDPPGGRRAPLGDLDEPLVIAAVGTIMTPAWVDDTLRSVHAAAIKMAADAGKSASIPVVELKQALRTQTGELEQNAARAVEMCSRLFGADRCREPGRAGALVTSYRTRVQQALDTMPDHIELGPGVGLLARGNFARLRTARWVAIALLLTCLLVTALIARDARQRLAALGGSVLAASLVCLLVIGVARFAAGSTVGDSLVQRAVAAATPGPAEEAVAQGLSRLGAVMIADATSTARRDALLLGLAGLALLLTSRLAGSSGYSAPASTTAGRKYDRARSATPPPDAPAPE